MEVRKERRAERERERKKTEREEFRGRRGCTWYRTVPGPVLVAG